MGDIVRTPSSSSNYTAKLWSSKLYMDTIMGIPLIADAIADGSLVRKDDLVRSAGDRVRMTFSKRLTGTGIIGDAPKRPNTKQVEYAFDDVVLDKLSSDPVDAKVEGTISQQRTAFDLQETLYPSVSDWFAQRMIAGLFNQLGGNTATSISFDGTTYTGSSLPAVTGLNAASAPTTFRSFFSTGSSDADVAADSTATLTLQAIDELETEAMTQRAGVNNFKMIVGKEYKFKFYVPMTGFKQLKQQAQSNGNITFPQIVLQKEAGGTDAAAQIGDSFQYSFTKVIAVPDHYIPAGVTAGAAQANTKRAIFVGAEAACLVFGKGYSEATGEAVPGFKVLSDDDDIEETVITVATGIFGIKKAVVDTYDQSVMTFSHYVA